ncbi:hypothetical protein HW115_02860 [Verrucomicrobiaceae bacterium N1E253]|uniref:Beta-galactosidase n=1 Tax=Oceaniferula marina TaxID=2748318 RepID=A0A851GH06_9BACT|nr:sugar-binding domain-containing protein [Oceaniferula marina]NWK54535.1 hypothetical protein [Oceaniferula marina]
MQVITRKVDNFPVVFHYGQVRPDFNDTSKNPHRSRLDLNGEWLFRFDPQSIGEKQRWFSTKTHLKDWHQVNVPHSWDSMPGGKYWDWQNRSVTNPPHYNGSAWYRRSFEWTPQQNKRQRIVFLGVQQRARVYLNNSAIAMHEGGGAPFSIDISERLKPGTNTLALKVTRLPNFKLHKDGKKWDEIHYTHTLHPKAPDCWPYAGILRDVYLSEEAAISIRKTQICTQNDKLQTTVIISNNGKQTSSVWVKLRCSALAVPRHTSHELLRLAPGQTRVVKLSLSLSTDAKSWSPQSPHLYKAHITLHRENGQAFDQLVSTFGIRKFTTSGPQFTLNQQAIFLKGISLYEENHHRGGAITRKDHEKLFQLARQSNSNFIRMHVTQRAPYAYQLADQQGFLICAEWAGFWYTKEAMAQQSQDKQSIYQTLGRCAVWDLMNHPSVVLWGLHNEAHQFCPEYETFVKTGRSLVQELDQEKRPITWAAWHPTKGTPHFEHADAVGFNEYRGAMDPFEDLAPDLNKAIKSNPSKPLIIMENGAWSKRGERGPVTQKSTEDWQADLLKRQWNVLTQYTPAFSGYTYWLLSDYRSRKTYTGNRRSNGYSRMGLYDEFHQPKLVSEVFRDLINPLKK